MADNIDNAPISDEEILQAEAELVANGLLPDRAAQEQPPELDDSEILAADEEMRQYGTDPKQVALATAEGMARGATLGLSDLVASEAGAPMHEVFARESENPVLSTVADIGTTIGLGALSGGTSLLARGGVAGAEKLAAKQLALNALKAAAAPTKAITRLSTEVGKIAEKQISKVALDKILKDTGRQKFVKQIIKKSIEDGATLGTEGALYSAGRALSNDALGKEDLTAESFVAQVGAGALFGGVAGGALGAGKSVAPMFKKIGSDISKRVSKTFDKLTSPEEAAMNLVGDIPSKIVKQERYMPDYKSRAVDYLKKLPNEGLDSDSIAAASEKYLNSTGKRLESVAKELDSATVKNPLLLPRSKQFYSPIVDDLNGLLAEYDVLGKVSKTATAPIRTMRDEYMKRALRSERLSFDQINKERKFIGKMLSKFKKSPDPTLGLEGASAAYGAYRRQIDNITERAAFATKDPATRQLFQDLKSLNRDYEIGSVLNPKLKLKAERGESVGMKDLLTMLVAFDLSGTAGALAGIGKVAFKRNTLQNLALKGDLALINSNIQKKISSTVPAIISAAKTAGRGVKFASLYALNQSGFSTTRDQNTGKIKLAENKKEAFQNIRDNITELATNSDKLFDSLSRGTYKLNAHAPEIGAYASTTATRAINFLFDKMPKDPNGTALMPFDRPYEPSSMELAKFERYVQAVENPMSVLDEAQNGTLTQEHVEALKAVYPVIYGEIRSKVYDEIATHGKEFKVPYNRKIQLGTLLDLPLDTSLNPTFIAAMQNSFLPTEQSSAAPPVSASKNLTMASRTEGGTESTINRRKS